MIKKAFAVALHYILPLVLFTASGSIIAFVVLRARPDVLGVTSSIDPTTQLITEVSGFVSVPSDEQPTIATITDISKLPSAPIFQKAQVGDKILAYPIAKKIILYRPNEKKVIDVGTFETVVPTPIATDAASLSIQLPTVVVLHEASKSAQLTTFLQNLKTKEPTVNITDSRVSLLSPPSETLVVDLNGNNSELVRKIATDFRLIASLWPTGETKPEIGDIAIIWKSSP